MKSLTIYVKPSCIQCTATFRAMDKIGLEYNVIQLVEGSDEMKKVKDWGYLHAPIVDTPYGDHWSGFLPPLIEQLAEDMSLEQTPANVAEITERRAAQLLERQRKERELKQRLRDQRAS